MITPIQRFVPPITPASAALRTSAGAFTEDAVDLNADHQGNNAGLPYSGEESTPDDEEEDEPAPREAHPNSTSLRVVA
jgi:hypothetical protein